MMSDNYHNARISAFTKSCPKCHILAVTLIMIIGSSMIIEIEAFSHMITTGRIKQSLVSFGADGCHDTRNRIRSRLWADQNASVGPRTGNRRPTRRNTNTNTNTNPNINTKKNNPLREKTYSHNPNRMATIKFESRLAEMQEKDRSGLSLTQSYCDYAMGLCVASDAWDQVLEVLAVMENQNLSQQRSTYRVCLQSCYENYNADSALKILSAMKEADVPPNLKDAELVILTCCKADRGKNKNSWRRGLDLLHDTAEKNKGTDALLSVAVYNSVINCMNEAGKWKEAVQLLGQMNSGSPSLLHPKPVLNTYHTVLEALVNFSQPDIAEQLLQDMRKVDLTPIPHSFNLVISAFLKKRQWRRAVSLLDHMKTLNIPPTKLTLNSIIATCARSGEAEAAVHLLDQMKQKNISPDIFTYNSVLSALSNAGRWKEALELLKKCKADSEVTPDIISYTSAMRACVKAKQSKRALSLFQAAKDENLRLDNYAYSVAIDACSKGGMWRMALDLLDNMRQENIKPNVYIYSVAISACGNGGEWQRALELLHQMREQNMDINTITYNSAIAALAKAAKSKKIDKNGRIEEQLWSKAIALLNQMEKDNIEQDAFSYSSAISACSSAGRWKEALDLIQIMENGGPKQRPNKIAYTAAITACGRASQWEHAVNLFENMKQKGLQPDKVAYNALVSALRVSRRPNEVYQVWEEMCGKPQNTITTTNDPASKHATTAPIIRTISPDIITVTDVIATLDRTSDGSDLNDEKSHIVFCQAVERGIVFGSLDSIWEVDLSGLTFPVARRAIRYVIQRAGDMVGSGEETARDIFLITGTGRRNHRNVNRGDHGAGTPTKEEGQILGGDMGLREYARQCLREDFDIPIYSTVPQNAQGTVLVSKEMVKSLCIEE